MACGHVIRYSRFTLLMAFTVQLIACQNDPHNLTSSEATHHWSGLLAEILKGYDSRIPPSFTDGHSTVVTCELYISSVDSISETTMDFSMTIFLRQTWRDIRLSFAHLNNASSIAMDARMVQSIWVPDLFFPNEKKSHFHDVTVPNRLLRIYNNGTVFYSARLSLTLSCAMRLYKFPLDNQICALQIESYAYTMEQMQLHWSSFNRLEISDKLELPQFSLEDKQTEYCTKYYSTGQFPCLRVLFYLRRDLGYYMIQTYVPSSLIVILSWVSFWINIEAVPARISLGVLTILTMTTQSSGSTRTLPRVSYIKAIDIWMSTCLFFVFAALLEFAIVNVLCRKEIRAVLNSRAGRDDCDKKLTCHDDNNKHAGSAEFIQDPSGKQKARRVDKISRTIFPVSFITFNAVYWITYAFWDDVA